MSGKLIVLTANTSWYLFNFRSNLIKVMQKEGYNVVAVAPRDTYSDRLPCPFQHISIDQGGTNPLKDFQTTIAFYQLFRRIKPDVVLNFTPKNNIYSTLAASRLRIRVINNIAGLGSIFVEERLAAKVARWLYKISQKHAYTVFFQNNEDMQFMLDTGYVHSDRAQRIPGSGVDLERFTPLPKSNDNGKIVFILIARMLYEKGIAEYVGAARWIFGKYPNTEFRLLGSIDSQNPSAIPEKVIQQWHESGVICYLGTSDKVEEEIAQTDCVVLPSYYREGVPRSLLEGAAMGKPIITTKNVGCKDVVSTGINGYLCELKNVDSLVECMLKIIDLSKPERNRMGMAGREYIEKNFDERLVIEAYLNEIQCIINT